MNKSKSRRWFIPVVLIGLTFLTFGIDSIVPMSNRMHRFDLIIIVLLMLITGATYIYQWAKAHNEGGWWEDDDWSNWGGI